MSKNFLFIVYLQVVKKKNRVLGCRFPCVCYFVQKKRKKNEEENSDKKN